MTLIKGRTLVRHRRTVVSGRKRRRLISLNLAGLGREFTGGRMRRRSRRAALKCSRVSVLPACESLEDRTLLSGSSGFTTIDPPGSVLTRATDVSGTNVVGFYVDSSGITHGFLYKIASSTYTTLDSTRVGFDRADFRFRQRRRRFLRGQQQHHSRVPVQHRVLNLHGVGSTRVELH